MCIRDRLHALEGAVPLPEQEPAFTVYDDIRQKLIAQGMPADQIAFIHEANTEVRKKELFSKVRTGQVRVLLGSTAKMGAGTNVPVSYTHLDVYKRQEQTGADDAPAGEGSGSHRGTESQRSHEVGGADEHLQSSGRLPSSACMPETGVFPFSGAGSASMSAVPVPALFTASLS